MISVTLAKFRHLRRSKRIVVQVMKKSIISNGNKKGEYRHNERESILKIFYIITI
jgi:hypothetical protein